LNPTPYEGTRPSTSEKRSKTRRVRLERAGPRPSRWEPRSLPAPRVEVIWPVLACPTPSHKPPTNQPGSRAGYGRRGSAWPTSLAPPLAPGAFRHATVSTVPGPRAGQTTRPGNRKGQDHDRGSRQLSPATSPTTQRSGTPRAVSPGPCSGWRCRAVGSGRRRSSPWSCARLGQACRRVAGQGRPCRNCGSAPVAGLGPPRTAVPARSWRSWAEELGPSLRCAPARVTKNGGA
jgi:hypothetical protein